MILSITIFYIGLSLLDIYYDFDWIEFSKLLITVPIIAMGICFVSGSLIFFIWFFLFLLEYKSILK
jgi:hypothetical protein